MNNNMVHERFLKVWALAFALPVLLLSSCSNDEPEGTEPDRQPGTGGDIEFSIGFAPQTRAATVADFTSTWENGDQIGIFAVTSGQALAASGNYIHNVRLTYNGTKWNLDSGVELWWPGSGGKLDFYAYHPYDASANNPKAITFNVRTDPSDMTSGKSNYNLSDLLTAKASKTGGYGKGETVPLTFSHALAMVQVAIPVEGKGYGPSENLTVMLRGVKAGASLDLGAISATVPGSGVSIPATGNDATSITMRRVEASTNTTSYTYRALVPAQTLAQGSGLFLFEHEQRQLRRDGALTTKLEMKAGTAVKFTRTLPQAVHTEFIPAGTFQMGSPASEPNRNSNETQHQVTLTQDFYLSRYQVTNAQYAAFLNAKDINGSSGIGQGSVTYDKDGSSTTATQAFVYDCTTGGRSQWGVMWNTGTSEWEPGFGTRPA